MDSFVDVSLERFLQNRPDLFGERSEYLRFEMDPTYSGSGGFNAAVIFGAIVYRGVNGDENRSKSLFIKQTLGTLSNNTDMEICHFTNEICFYSYVLPFFNSFEPVNSYFPQFFDSSLQINVARKKALIIFENLQTSGYRLAEKASFLDCAHLSMMLRKLGNFHAFSFKAKTKDRKRFRILCDMFVDTTAARFRNYFNMLLRLSKNGVNNLRGDRKYATRLEKLEKILETAEKFVEQLFKGDRNEFGCALCHGDYLRGNVVFKYENGKPVDMKMIDMATCVLAFPVLDVASVLYLNADQRMREEHWDDLINEYYAGLTEHFVDVGLPSRGEVLEQFQYRSVYIYFVATFFLRECISMDNNLKSLEDYHREYGNVSLEIISQEELCVTVEKVGGTAAEEALQNILKDMIDRGFI